METNSILTALDVLVDFANLHVKCGDNLYALQLVLVCLNHPAVVHSSKVRAEQSADELKGKLTAKELQSAQKLAEESVFEAVIAKLLAEGRQ